MIHLSTLEKIVLVVPLAIVVVVVLFGELLEWIGEKIASLGYRMNGLTDSIIEKWEEHNDVS